MTEHDTNNAACTQQLVPLDIAVGLQQWRSYLDAQLLAAVEADPSATFRQLFDGRTNAYGWSHGGKLGTLRRLTEAQYERHLAGAGSDADWSLGLVPVRDDNTLRFAGLDLDAKGLTDAEVNAIVRRSHELGLPLAWTLSRSGGLHGWLFLAEPTDPAGVRRILRSWGERLGWGEKAGGDSKARGDRFFEVFPKQEWLPPDKAGNWIRLPWPGGENAAGRRGVWLDEEPPTFVEWLAFALQQRVSPAQLEERLRELGPATSPAPASELRKKRGRPRSGEKADRASVPDAPGDALADEPLGTTREPDVTIAEVRHLLGQLASEWYEDYDRWVRALMALHHQFAETPQEESALALAIEWSQQSTKYEDGAVEAKWRSFAAADSGNEITIRSLRHWARANELENRMSAMNTKYAHVLCGGSSILYTPPNGEPDFLDTRRWKEHHANERLPWGTKDRSVADIWLEYPARRSYYSVTFDPTAAPYSDIPSRKGPPDAHDYNLWPGLAIEPSSNGSCSLFLDHLRYQVCGGDHELFHWLVQWLAHIVRRPQELAGTAVALRGPQGSGKTLVGEVMGVILGDRLYTKVSRPEELTGRFNAHHHGRLLLQVEEGFWAGDKKAEGALKDMITSPTRRIERKFMDPLELPNLGRLLITSNNAWVIPAGLGKRRFAVFDVSGDRANDLAYFGALRDQMFNEGGCARLHQFLLHEVVIDWDLIKRPPRTRALLDQQLESLDLEDRWLFDVLSEGQLPGDMGGTGFATTDALYGSYQLLARSTRAWPRSKERLAQSLTDRLGDAVTPARPREKGARARGYRFAALSECRARFAQRLALVPTWPEPTEWEADDLLAGFVA